MITIRCPYCNELRPEDELQYCGEVYAVRPAAPLDADDLTWTEYLFMRANRKGLQFEHWCCTAGCGRWFKVARDTVSHEIVRVLRFDQPFAVEGENA